MAPEGGAGNVRGGSVVAVDVDDDVVEDERVAAVEALVAGLLVEVVEVVDEVGFAVLVAVVEVAGLVVEDEVGRALVEVVEREVVDVVVGLAVVDVAVGLAVVDVEDGAIRTGASLLHAHEATILPGAPLNPVVYVASLFFCMTEYSWQRTLPSCVFPLYWMMCAVTHWLLAVQ